MKIESRLVEIFLTMAGIDGMSGAERDVSAFIISFLKALNLKADRDDAGRHIGGNSGNVICRIGGGGDVVLIAHMDTASTTKGLKANVLDDRITSDGTTILGADDRAGIAAILFSVEKLLKDRAAIRDCTLAFTVDEERGLGGSSHLRLDPAIKMGFVFDSHLRPGYFIHRTYGAKEFNLTVTGKAAHSCSPHKGLNSIKIASEGMGRLRWGRLDAETTANVGAISGGIIVNIIPETTRLKGEARSADIRKVDETIEEIKAAFTAAAEEAGGEAKLDSKWLFKPYEIPPDAEVRMRLEEALISAGLESKPMITPGGSDANSLNAMGIPAVNIGIGAQDPHSMEEFILLEDLQKTAEIVQFLMKKDDK